MKLFGRDQNDQRVEIVISNRTIVRVLVMVVLLIVGLAALQKVSHALLILFVAFFLALALNAPVHWIAQHLPGKRRGSRVAATSISYIFVVLVLAGFISLLVPPAIRQTTNFINNIPVYVDDLRNENSASGTFIRDNNLQGLVDSLSEEASGLARASGGTALATVSTVGTSVVSLFAVLALTFMMLVEGPRWVRLIRRLIPEEKREYATELARDMYAVVRGFVNGQVALAAIAALMILPVMLLLGIPYAGALAVIVFICGLIPMIGHIIGATLVTLIALFTSIWSAILILSFYVLYQQIENYVVQPRVQANTTNMSPLLVLSAVIIGINLNGLLGGLVAIPVMGCIRIIVIDYLQRTGRLGKADTQVRTSHIPSITPGAK